MNKASSIIKKGSQGSDVILLQGLLNDAIPINSLPRGVPLAEDGNFGTDTESAAKTYQQMHRLKVDGVVGASTWKALGVQFVPKVAGTTELKLVQLPQMCGFGYYSYSPPGEQFGTAKTIQTLVEVAKAMSDNVDDLEIGIGDISYRTGGEFPPHKSHRQGRHADIRPLRKDKATERVTISDSNYSHEYTKALVETLLAHENVKRILFNDTKIIGVKSYAGHDNHLHVMCKA